jgi:energy-coupling factor transporter ATP-binding protein EcfA2
MEGVTLLLCGVYALKAPIEPVRQPVADGLHRRYFADRIVSLLNDDSRIKKNKRVAIIGEWGSGKTRVLDLVEEKLIQEADTSTNSHPARIVRVNPWKATSAEEAWATIASEIDRVLGYRPSRLRFNLNDNFIAKLFSLLPDFGISKDFYELINWQGGIREQTARETINKRLIRIKGKTVVLVDDMERTDPVVLRKLFPVIDNLAQIENVAFVFAIDPTKVAEAFGEKTRIGDNTQGYLDKVFDLQFELPEPSLDDILDLLMEEASATKSEKLAAALPDLRPYLPKNPRTAMRFLEVAVTNEQLFLGRYGPVEKRYPALFLSWLADVEFPGLLAAILELPGDKYAVLQRMWVYDLEDSDKKQLSKILVSAIGIQELDVRYSSKMERIGNLLSGFGMFAFSLKYAAMDGALDLQWARSGFKVVQTLSANEREQLLNAWILDEQGISLEKFVRSIEGTLKYANSVEEVIKQFYNHLLSRLLGVLKEDSFSDEAGPNTGRSLDLAQRLVRHIGAAKLGNWSLDIKCFTGGLIHDMLAHESMFLEYPKLVGKVKELACAVEMVFEQIIGCLTTKVCVNLRISLERVQQASKREFPAKSLGREIGRLIMSRVREDVTSHLRSGTVQSLFENEREGVQLGLNIFWEPTQWLALDGEWMHELAKVVDEARHSNRLAESLCEICADLFLRPHVIGDTNPLLVVDGKHTGYIASMWKGAMNSTYNSQARTTAIELREELLKRCQGSALERIMALFPDKRRSE